MRMSTPTEVAVPKEHEGTREISLAQAVNEALAEELRRDPAVFLIGEDVAEAGTPFKVTSGLVEEFGPERVLDSPISEAGITGIGLGAAMTGMRPVVDIMFGDFLTLVMDQLVNQAAKVHYMSGGRLKAPLTVRTTLGATRRSAAQHSQSLHAWVSHVPGLKVALPSTPYDAKGLLKSAIRDDNPVVFIEDKMMFQTKGPVPGEEYTIPFGVADVKRDGEDVTIVATSSMVYVALEAAERLAEEGVSAEVVDPRTLVPLDRETLVASAKKTGRVIVVDEGHRSYGASAELAASIAEDAFYWLDGPLRRAAAAHLPVPFSPVVENECVALVNRVLYELGSEHVEGVNAISGERCSPHPHVFTDRMLRPGDPAYFDILHAFNGYRTCYYRTFAVGSASHALVDAYKRCRDILDHAIALVRPGTSTADVVSVWPKAQEFGFPDEEAAFALQYGHGVGLSIWEKPIFSRLVSFDHPETIQEGMVFALETFWPASDGWSAARIEEQLVVTKDGCEVITRFPAEELLVAGGGRAAL